jgi:hypothetical protein
MGAARVLAMAPEVPPITKSLTTFPYPDLVLVDDVDGA